MPKILFVLGNYKNGGMAMRATNLANEFARIGFEVDILVTGQADSNPFVPIHPNVRVVSLCQYNSESNHSLFNTNRKKQRERKIGILKRVRMITKLFPKIDKSIAAKIGLLRSGEKLLVYVINIKPDIIISLGLPYLEPVVSVSKEVKCKVFYAEKNAPEIEFPNTNTEQYERYFSLLERTDGIIVQTQEAKRFFEDRFSSVFVINNPIKKYLPLPYHGVRRKSIVNFCRLSPQKNIDLLIDAFALLKQNYPNYCLEIYGNTVVESEIEYKKHIEKKVNTLKLNHSVFIFPPTANVHEKIMDCTMFVSSSDYEGLSNSMIEAMAIGLPCICTDCMGGGTREVMKDKENGLIVPVKDPQAMCEAMKCYIENPDFAEQCGKNASTIRERLDVEIIAREWIAVMLRCKG